MASGLVLTYIDVGHLQLRPRRGRVRHRVPLLPTEHRARRARSSRRSSSRCSSSRRCSGCCSTASCCAVSRRHRCTRASSARSGCSSRSPASIQWLVIAVGNDVLGLGLEGNDAINEGLPVPGHRAKTPHDTYKIGGVVLNSDQIAVFVVAAIAAIVLWFVIRRTARRARDARRRRPRLAGRAPRRERGAHVGGRVDAHDDPRRPRRGAHRAALPTPGLRVHARRPRLARGGRPRRPAVDPDRVRRRSAARRDPEPRRGLQRRHPARSS